MPLVFYQSCISELVPLGRSHFTLGPNRHVLEKSGFGWGLGDCFFLEVTLESENGSNTKRIALGPVPLQLAGLQAVVAAAFRLPLGAQMSIAILDGEDQQQKTIIKNKK
jgi:hypothetical protein